MHTFAVFFYGLNMDSDHLLAQGAVPREPRTVFIEGQSIRLGEKAMLLPDPFSRAYGIVFNLTHEEMSKLYSGLPDYVAEPFLATTEDGQKIAVLSMVHRNPPLNSIEVPEYAARWRALLQKLALPLPA